MCKDGKETQWWIISKLPSWDWHTAFFFDKYGGLHQETVYLLTESNKVIVSNSNIQWIQNVNIFQVEYGNVSAKVNAAN